MAEAIRVVHYLNQFFGGLGGEDKAYEPVQARREPVGPGRALQGALGDQATIVGTLIAGRQLLYGRAGERQTGGGVVSGRAAARRGDCRSGL